VLSAIVVLHVLACIFLILIVLLQAGKGASLGAAFGGGTSQTAFGARRGNILTRITTGGAVLFMLTSLLITIIYSRQYSGLKQPGRPEVRKEEQVATEEEERSPRKSVKSAERSDRSGEEGSTSEGGSEGGRTKEEADLSGKESKGD
jgi:preprotein translocase subunit SecG